MTQRFDIHPQDPQPRFIKQVVYQLQQGALAAYPTDSCYAFGCTLGNRSAAQKITRIRKTDKGHNFTLVCRDLSEIATYARIENSTYRLLKANTPGPYTFILKATGDVPRRLQNPRRKTIGIRVPDHPVTMAILEELGGPIMSSTLLLPGSDLPLTDPEEVFGRLDGEVDLVIDAGSCGVDPTTVVDLIGEIPVVLRNGKGDSTPFE